MGGEAFSRTAITSAVTCGIAAGSPAMNAGRESEASPPLDAAAKSDGAT